VSQLRRLKHEALALIEEYKVRQLSGLKADPCQPARWGG
jgi:hypothetical protein